MSLSVASDPTTKRDISNGSQPCRLKSSPKPSPKSSSNPMKILSKGISQPFIYGVRKGGKLFGRRATIKHKNDGRVQPYNKDTMEKQQDAIDVSENIVGIGTAASGTQRYDQFTTKNSSIDRRMDGRKPINQRLSSFRSQGDDQDLSTGENGQEVVLLNLDESHQNSLGGKNVQEQILSNLERSLRYILLLLCVYLTGVYQPFTFINADVLIFASQMISVAWGTCLFIQLISWWMTETNVEYYEESPVMQKGEENISQRGYARCVSDPNHVEYYEKTPVMHKVEESISQKVHTRCFSQPNLLQLIPVKGVNIKSQEIKKNRRLSTINSRIEKDSPTKSSKEDSTEFKPPLEKSRTKFLQPQNHPELEDLVIINELNMERGYPNGELMNIDNAIFQGSMLPMFRTSDIDVANDATSNHFKGKRRYFEMQMQFKMKNVPKDQIFMGFEMDEPIKLGMIQRAIVGAVMKFMKKRNQGLTCDLSGEEEQADGGYVKPHISLPLETCADLFVTSKPGEEIPQLGTTLYEDPEIQKMRKKGNHCISYNTEDTYTISIWSAYVDFVQWRCLNLPAIRPFSLSSVIGNQTFRITWYLADPSLSQHRQCDVDKFVSFEFGHRKKSRIGTSAKNWMQTMGSGLNSNTPVGNIHADLPIVTLPGHLEGDETSTDSEQCEDISVSSFGDESNQILTEDTGTLEELGEGLYLNSGDPIQICESILGADPSFFTSAGGYAVLQSQTASTIVVEKVFDDLEKQGTLGSYTQSKLIKNGDTVMISLIEDDPNHATKITRYLTIHRGWWLKWASNVPKTNGYFQIFTNEMEELVEVENKIRKQMSFEAQSTYVRLGGTFQLRVDDKLGLHVGVRMESSPTFGGRVMGLYEEHGHRGFERDDSSPQSKGKDLIKPLYLRASLPCNNEALGNVLSYNKEASEYTSENVIEVAHTHASVTPVEPFYVDVPAWLEIMHRRDRGLQLLYLVRMTKSSKAVATTSKVEVSINGDIDASDIEKAEKGRALALHSRVRLRTGKNLAPAMRLSLDLNRNADVGVKGKGGDISSYGGLIQDSNHDEQEDDPVSDNSISQYCDIGRVPPRTNDVSDPIHNRSYSSLSGASGADIDSDESIPSTDDNEQVYNNFPPEGEDNYQKGIHPPSPTSRKLNWVRMSKAGIGKAAKGVKIAGKGVKIGTVLAGKGVMKSGKIVGQTMLPMKNRAHTSPPVKEPRLHSKKNQHKKRSAVNKTLTKFRNKHALLQSTNQVMAGQLTAPGQSCRIMSHVLSELSSIAIGESSSESSINAAASLLSSQLVPVSEFDMWFLRGGSVELGVVPMKNEDGGNLLGECVVARCLWESHWREEACMIYDPYVVFYAPLSKKPCLKLSYIDIQQIRLVQASDNMNPLPGFPLISIETAWRCHYLAFIDEEGRAKFQETLNSAIYACPQCENDVHKDTRKINMWKDLQRSSEQSLSRENGKWARVMSSKKLRQRVVHNSRRMAFDSEIFPLDGSQTAERSVGLFVEDLLSQALSFTLEALEVCENDFVRFLDCSSRLRTLPLQKLNLSGKEAFCICVNLYHCLLQHSLLLSPCGPPTKKTIQTFMRTNCYEIGGDVFSLAELQIRVIRGTMSKAIHPRSPFVQAPKKSRAHLAYALGEADPRINFVLNTGDMTKPSHVPILTPDELDEQLSACSTSFLREQVSVDLARKTVTLPKVCEVYRNDFGDGDANCCVHYCLQYLDENTQSQLLEWLKLGSPYIRYHHPCDRFHSRLRLLSVAMT